MGPTSTNASATVMSRELAADVTEQLLAPRRRYLKHRAPKSRYVHDLRRKMAAELVKPAAMLLAVSMTDQDDGVPLEMVVQPYLSIVAMLTARHQPQGGEQVTTSLLPLIQRESRAECAVDQAEHEVLATPESPEALDRLLDAAAALEAEEERLITDVRTRRARLSVAGAR